jgi:hypothetical protein
VHVAVLPAAAIDVTPGFDAGAGVIVEPAVPDTIVFAGITFEVAGTVAAEDTPVDAPDVNIIVVRIVYAVTLAPEVAEIGRTIVETVVTALGFDI